MNRSRILFIAIIFMISFLVVEFLFMKMTKTPTMTEINLRKNFTAIAMLPDLAVHINSTQTRHRSLTDINSIYRLHPMVMDTDFASGIYKRRP